MATTYTATAWDTVGTSSAADLEYKDVTVTVANGDLLVAFGATANTSGTGTGAIATQSGSTGAWLGVASNNAASSTGWTSGYTTATASGSVTVRVTVPRNSTLPVMGAAVWVIPAAEWQGTPAFTTLTVHDTDGKVSVTVGAYSTVLYGGADWSALAPGATSTPLGGTDNTTFSDGTNYAVYARAWGGEVAGTRNYGPSAPAGNDWAGRVAVVEAPPPVQDEGTKHVYLTYEQMLSMARRIG